MPDYQVFGGVLRSDLEFTDLNSCVDATPHWYLTHAEFRPMESPVFLGREEIDIGVHVTAFSTELAIRLVFDDTGTFDIARDGRRIRWTPTANPDLDLVRRDVLGRVFAVALELGGALALHGSAVQLRDTAIAFLAPKYHGKSTTAAAMIASGARPLADDLVGVTAGVVPRVMPAASTVSLRTDSAECIAGMGGIPCEIAGSPKVQVAWDSTMPTMETPLSAIYLLTPFQGAAERQVRRERLAPFAAALSLLGQSKIGSLLGVEQRARRLAQMAWLADRTPVYRLELPRDYARLRETTEALWSWESAASSEGVLHAANAC